MDLAELSTDLGDLSMDLGELSMDLAELSMDLAELSMSSRIVLCDLAECGWDLAMFEDEIYSVG